MEKAVLFAINNIGGLYNFRKELVQACVREKVKVYISSPLKEGVWKSFFEDIGCKLIDTSIDTRGTNPLKDILLSFKYFYIIKKIKPDVVLTYTVKPNIYAGLICRMLKIRQLANITGLGDAVEAKGILSNFVVFLYRLALSNNEVVFFQNSSNLKFCVNNKIAKGRTHLLPGSGVNLSYFKYELYPISDVLKFGTIGRITKQKGADELLKAVKTLKSKYFNKIEFHILGFCDSEFADEVSLMDKTGMLKFHGSSTDIRPFVKDIHCLIHPSHHEGMSNVCLECSAMGRPVITTNVPGCKETVEEAHTGFLINPGDVNSLVAAVEKFINLTNDERVNMGVAARKKMEKEFDRQIVVEAYMKEINAND